MSKDIRHFFHKIDLQLPLCNAISLLGTQPVRLADLADYGSTPSRLVDHHNSKNHESKKVELSKSPLVFDGGLGLSTQDQRPAWVLR